MCREGRDGWRMEVRVPCSIIVSSSSRAAGRARTLAAAGIAGGLLVTLAGSAQAQFFGWWGSPPAYGVPENAVIPPGEIYRIVAARGYQVTGGLQRNGRVYLVDAVDQWGRALRLVVDAYQGDILQRFATAPPRPAASIPQPQSHADLYPQYSSYPAYPDAAPPPARRSPRWSRGSGTRPAMRRAAAT